MKNLRELRDLRAVKAGELDALNEKAKTESRDLTEAEDTQVEAILAELRSIDRKIDIAVEAEAEAARRAAKMPPVQTGIEGNRDTSAAEQRDLHGFSLVRGLQLMAQNKPLDGIEAEVHAEAVKDARANGVHIEGFGVPTFVNKRGQTVTGQTSAAGDQGGVTVPTELNGLIDALWSNNFLSQVGARRLAGLQGNQEFMVQLTTPTIQEKTEIEAITNDEITFGKFAMAPNRRGTAIPFSKQLLLQSSLDVENLIIENIRKGLDYKLNAEAIIVLLAAITSGNGNLLAMGANGAVPTYDSIVQLEGLIDAANANQGSLKYLTNSKVKSQLKRTQVFSGTNGQPVYGADNVLNGYGAVISNVVPSNLTKGTASSVCSAAVFGNFSDLYVGMWGGADFIVDNLTLASTGQVKITVNMFWDIEVARAKSFAGVKDYLTT